MKALKENDVVSLREKVEGRSIPDFHSLVIPSGSEGTIVAVWGDPSRPSKYEVEFFIRERNSFALASIEATNAVVIWES